MDVTQPCIKVQVHSKYIAEQSNPAENHYIFAYLVTIKNLSPKTVQLLSRRWLRWMSLETGASFLCAWPSAWPRFGLTRGRFFEGLPAPVQPLLANHDTFTFGTSR